MARLARALVLSVSLALLGTCAFAQPNPSGALPASAADSVPDAVILDPRPTIPQYLSSTGEHQVLLLAVSALGNLSATLSAPGTRFTVFAPTDNAFANLVRRFTNDPVDASDAQRVFDQLAEGLAELRDIETAGFIDLRSIVAYHVIGQALSYQRLENEESVTTTQGEDLVFVDGVIIDGDDTVNVTAGPRNVFMINGWVNVVNEVLLPFQLETALQDAGLLPLPPQVEESPLPDGGDGAVVTPQPGAVPVGTGEDGGEGEDGQAGLSTPTPDDNGGAVTPVTGGEGDGDGDGDGDGVGGEGEELDTSASAEPSAEEDEDDAVCFPASAPVHLSDGKVVRMDALQAGDAVLTGDAGNAASAVFLFTHRTHRRTARFYKITTSTGHVVSLTAGHYLRTQDGLVAARAVRVGDVLRTVSGEASVVEVQREIGVGLFAPHTMHGDLVVGGVVVSGYSTAVHPRLAHALLAPVRWIVKVAGVTEPLGAVFYGGADALARVVPGGRERH